MGKKEMLDSVKEYLLLFGEVGNYERDILKAMFVVDRKNFVSEDIIEYAYIDNALPIEKNQTVSQPSTVARMLQLLRLRNGDKVLEVGAGSGWNACLIGYLVGEKGSVLSLDIIDELVEKARERIEKLEIKNVEILKKDFRNLDEKFDRIIFTAGLLWEQEIIIREYADKHLEDDGILICPRGSGRLIIFEKVNGEIKKSQTNEEYVFVRLIL